MGPAGRQVLMECVWSSYVSNGAGDETLYAEGVAEKALVSAGEGILAVGRTVLVTKKRYVALFRDLACYLQAVRRGTVTRHRGWRIERPS